MNRAEKVAKKTILQILPALNSGGVERGTIDLSLHLKNAGFIPIVASAGGKMLSTLYDNGIKHIQLPLVSKNPLTMFNNYKAIKELIRYYNIDIVHARSRGPAWSSYYASREMGAKFLTTFHGIYSDSNYLKHKYNSIMLRGERVVATSEYTRSHIIENYADVVLPDIRVIPRGVDLNEFSESSITYSRIAKAIAKFTIPDDRFIILMPARFTHWKGQDTLLKAIAASDSREKFYIILVGEIGESNKFYHELVQLARSLRIDHLVTFSDSYQDLAAVYCLSDLVVNCSRLAESFGRVSIEAGAMGRIYLGTNLGATRETIRDQETGFLYNVDDHFELSSLIERVFHFSNDEHKRFGKSAMIHVKDNFSLQQMLNTTSELYDEILA